MNENIQQSLLLCSNGSPESLPALGYGVWLAQLLQAPVLLAGIVEHPGERKKVEQMLEKTRARLVETGVPHETTLLKGPTTQVVAKLAEPDKHLVVIGPL